MKCQTDVIGIPTSMDALGGQIEALVRTSPECAWSATSNAAWLHVQPPSGQGEVAITLQVAENHERPQNSGSYGIMLLGRRPVRPGTEDVRLGG